MKILKFGGKSLSSQLKRQNIAKYIKSIYQKDTQIIVIVSAIGSTTDELISNVKNLKIKSKREMDVLLSTGEMQSASIFAMTLQSNGVPAESLLGFQMPIKTYGKHTASKISKIGIKRIKSILDKHKVAVVAGFQGINKLKDITTLGRGGSDTTAVAIATQFNTEVEIYSDFDGVYAIDPRVHKSKQLKKVSFNQMLNMALSGAKVIDNRAVKIAKKFNIKIISKSAENPNLTGTIVDKDIECNNIAISTQTMLNKINIISAYDDCLNKILSAIKKVNAKYKIMDIFVDKVKASFMCNSNDFNNIIDLLLNELNLTTLDVDND